MPKSHANGVEIHYEITGAGPPMVLIHAIPFDNSLWLYQAAHLSTWFTVISVDLRGWGRTEKVTTPFTMEDMCRDVLGVMDDLATGPAIVMGCSIGSKTALMLGALWPDRFSAVIQVGGNSGPQDMARRITGYGEEEFSPYRFEHMGFGVTESFADSAIGKYLFANFAERDPRHVPTAIIRTFEALSAGDVRDHLATYPLPTMIINGEFDNARPRGEQTAGLIPHARHEVLPGAGHACMIEDPAGFDALVLDFLSEQGLLPEIE
jgi:pimeloyl-ACP methyl ester carboxylesterase